MLGHLAVPCARTPRWSSADLLTTASTPVWSRCGLDPGAQPKGERKTVRERRASLARQTEDCHMRSKRISGDTFGIRGKAWLGACCVLTAMCSVTLAADRRHRSNTLVPRDFFEGKELFEKSWEPGKPSPTGGDGLGPLYNETSCVGCHHLGGTGGGGDERAQCSDADGRRRFGPIADGSHALSGRDGGPASRVPEPCQHRAPPARDHPRDRGAAEKDRVLLGGADSRGDQGAEEGEPEHPGPLRRRAHRCDPRQSLARS